MKATNAGGSLKQLKNCYIYIPDFVGLDSDTPNGATIYMNILPEISDSKGASYPDEHGMGRTMPFKSYQGSENRAISWTAHFMACNEGDTDYYINIIRMLEACTYPQSDNSSGAPYTPPPICQLRCGELLSSKNANDVCCILKNYSIKFDTTVPWDDVNYIPYKMDIDMQFEVVYDQSNLPGAELILTSGY